MGLADLMPWKELIGNTVGKLIDRIPDKNKKNEMAHEFQQLMESNDFQEVMQDKEIEKQFMETMAIQIESVNAISLQDSKSKFWLAANWRPLSCLGITICVMDYYVITPKLIWIQSVWFPDTPPFPVMQEIEQLLYLMGGVLGVFGVGRSFEKWKGVATR